MGAACKDFGLGGGGYGIMSARKVGGERGKGEKEGGSGWFLKRGEVLVVEGREEERRGEERRGGKKGGGETRVARVRDIGIHLHVCFDKGRTRCPGLGRSLAGLGNREWFGSGRELSTGA